MRRSHVTCALLPLIGLASCAALNYRAVHQHTPPAGGAVDRGRARAHRGDIPFDRDGVARVKLFAKRVPAGFAYDEIKDQLKVAAGAKHRIIARVRVDFPVIENFGMTWWFYDYRPEQRWRRYLCHWQIPLIWVTLGFWKLVPLYYPCHPAFWHTASIQEIAGRETRMAALRQALKAEALRRGGDAVVAVYVNHRNARGFIVKLGGR